MWPGCPDVRPAQAPAPSLRRPGRKSAGPEQLIASAAQLAWPLALMLRLLLAAVAGWICCLALMAADAAIRTAALMLAAQEAMLLLLVC